MLSYDAVHIFFQLEIHNVFFYKLTLFWVEPRKEIEITTNKLIEMCLKYERAYKNNVYLFMFALVS